MGNTLEEMGGNIGQDAGLTLWRKRERRKERRLGGNSFRLLYSPRKLKQS